MNLIYSYIQTKIIERAVNFCGKMIRNYKNGDPCIKESVLFTDELWSVQLQKYYFGNHYVYISNRDEDIVVLSSDSLDEKETEKIISAPNNIMKEPDPHKVTNDSDSDSDDENPHEIK